MSDPLSLNNASLLESNPQNLWSSFTELLGNSNEIIALLSRPFQGMYLSCAAVYNVSDLCLTRTGMARFGNESRISLVDKTDTMLQLGPKT